MWLRIIRIYKNISASPTVQADSESVEVNEWFPVYTALFAERRNIFYAEIWQIMWPRTDFLSPQTVGRGVAKPQHAAQKKMTAKRHGASRPAVQLSSVFWPDHWPYTYIQLQFATWNKA